MSNSESGAPNGAPNGGGGGDALHAFSDALANAVAALAPSVVAVHARRRIPASGVVWRNGYVVVTDHTIRRERDITVTLNDGRQVAATLVGRDASTDLALLKLADDSVPAAPRAPSSDSARPGHIVLSVGRPGSAITATLGTIHATGGEWRTWQGGQMSELIRVDMTVHDGFSGSALMDSAGRVLGINSSILSRGAPATIPAATVDRVVDQLLSGGRVPRGWLGVGTQPVRLPEKVRADANLTQEVGLLLVNIASNSPAEAAGLFVGDTLISLAHTPTREAEDVLAILGPDTVGKTLTARIIRAGAVLEIPVVIGESPHAAPRSGPGGHGGGEGGAPGGGGPFGKGPFGGNPFGGNPFGHHHGGREHRRHEGRREREFFNSDDEGMYTDDQRAYRRHMHERHEARMRKAAEAFEKFREFSQSFGLGFASGCDPNKSH
ncbi:MAG: trypsin-like peptidase domain-containing protein [Gemmatimonadaceae bacterium]